MCQFEPKSIFCIWHARGYRPEDQMIIKIQYHSWNMLSFWNFITGISIDFCMIRKQLVSPHTIRHNLHYVLKRWRIFFRFWFSIMAIERIFRWKIIASLFIVPAQIELYLALENMWPEFFHTLDNVSDCN